MPQKISVDEIISRRKDLGEDAGRIVKSAKAPTSWNKDRRSAHFTMNAQEVDRYGDVVMTAGINTDEFSRNPVALLFHSSRTWPIGTWSNVEKVLKGRPPRLEGDLNLLPEGGPVPEIDQTAWMIENGGVRACSIGFRPDWDQAEMIRDEDGEWTGGIRWNASELLECSVVPIGASPSSLVRSADGNWRMAKELVEEVLDTYARTPEGLLVPREEYERAYRLTVEKIKEDIIVAKEITEPEIVDKSAEVSVEEVVEDSAAVAKTAKSDTDGMSIDQINKLAASGVVFLTELKVDEKTYGGDVIANSWDAAEKTAGERDPVEKVIGQLVEVTPVEQGKSFDRAFGDSLVKFKMADKDGNLIGEEKATGTISIDVDTSAAEEKIAALTTKAEGFIAKFGRLFGIKSAEPDPIVAVEEKSPPTAEEMEAALTKAAAVRERLSTKGLIAA